MKLLSVVFGMALAQDQVSVTRLETTSLTNAAAISVGSTWSAQFPVEHMTDGLDYTLWISSTKDLTTGIWPEMSTSLAFNQATTVKKVGIQRRHNGAHWRYGDLCFHLLDDANNELTAPECTTGSDGTPFRTGEWIEVEFPYVTNVKRIDIRLAPQDNPVTDAGAYDDARSLQIAEIYVDTAENCPNAGWEPDANGFCQNPCLNDAWQTDANGECQPKPAHFDLQCTASGMVLTIDEAVYPDGEGVTFEDSSCTGTKTGNTWTISSALDDCQTTMALVTNTDGSESFAFSNKVKFNSFSADAQIYTQNVVHIDITCNYDKEYSIEVSDVSVVSENVDADSQDVDGQFTFGLVQYMDSDMSDAADAGDATPLGGTMYFQLTMANPVSSLDWVITDCVVHDDALGLHYSIITNQCPDSNTQAQMTPVGNPKSAISFSYMGFKFTNSVDNQQADMRLACSVTVCDASDSTSTCATGCV